MRDRSHDIRGRAGAAPAATSARPWWSESVRPTDEVTDASMDSFPASDPPSWGGMRIGPPAPVT